MHIVFGRVRQFVVDHVRQLIDVDAARSHIGRHQHAQAAILERFQRLGALLLALVTVNRIGRQAAALKVAREAAAHQLGIDEHQRLDVRLGAQQVSEQFALVLSGHRVHHVGDGLGHHVAPRHFDQLRRLEHLVSELLDFVRKGGGKQQALALRRQQRQDALDVGNETHVEHAVRFIKHQHFDLGQVDRFLFDVIEQPARGGDDDFDATAQLGLLRTDVDAAVDAQRTQRQMLAVGDHRIMHLHRQLARRRQDQRPRLVARRRSAGVGMTSQPVQQRQSEAGRLAGAGLRAAHDIMTGNDNRNCLTLDGGRLAVAGITYGIKQGGDEAEIGKAHGRPGYGAASDTRVEINRPLYTAQAVHLTKDFQISPASPARVWRQSR